MAIKVKNFDKNSHLRRDYIPFGLLSTASSISNAQVILAVMPNKGVIKRAVITGTSASACGSDAIHVVVSDGTTSFIDNTITGTCAGLAEYFSYVMTATAFQTLAANTLLRINVSASEIAGSIAGYIEVELDPQSV